VVAGIQTFPLVSSVRTSNAGPLRSQPEGR
jgi:hypothetical protein